MPILYSNFLTRDSPSPPVSSAPERALIQRPPYLRTRRTSTCHPTRRRRRTRGWSAVAARSATHTAHLKHTVLANTCVWGARRPCARRAHRPPRSAARSRRARQVLAAVNALRSLGVYAGNRKAIRQASAAAGGSAITCCYPSERAQ
jgi:hypothetical protein